MQNKIDMLENSDREMKQTLAKFQYEIDELKNQIRSCKSKSKSEITEFENLSYASSDQDEDQGNFLVQSGIYKNKEDAKGAGRKRGMTNSMTITVFAVPTAYRIIK